MIYLLFKPEKITAVKINKLKLKNKIKTILMKPMTL